MRNVTISIASLFLLPILLFVFSNNSSVFATGGDSGSLSNCSFANNRAGGVELFNYVDQGGGSRIMCVNDPYPFALQHAKDDNLGTDEGGNDYDNIWGFNNKTNSLKLRANPGCETILYLYDSTGTPLIGEGWFREVINDNRNGSSPVNKLVNLSSSEWDKASSLELEAYCN